MSLLFCTHHQVVCQGRGGGLVSRQPDVEVGGGKEGGEGVPGVLGHTEAPAPRVAQAPALYGHGHPLL